MKDSKCYISSREYCFLYENLWNKIVEIEYAGIIPANMRLFSETLFYLKKGDMKFSNWLIRGTYTHDSKYFYRKYNEASSLTEVQIDKGVLYNCLIYMGYRSSDSDILLIDVPLDKQSRFYRHLDEKLDIIKSLFFPADIIETRNNQTNVSGRPKNDNVNLKHKSSKANSLDVSFSETMLLEEFKNTCWLLYEVFDSQLSRRSFNFSQVDDNSIDVKLAPYDLEVKPWTGKAKIIEKNKLLQVSLVNSKSKDNHHHLFFELPEMVDTVSLLIGHMTFLGEKNLVTKLVILHRLKDFNAIEEQPIVSEKLKHDSKLMPTAIKLFFQKNKISQLIFKYGLSISSLETLKKRL